MSDKLSEARTNIDNIDKQLVELFEKRMAEVEKVAEFKKEHGLSISDPDREEKLIKKNTGYLTDDSLEGYCGMFFRDIIKISKIYQQKLLSGMKISYCGTSGAFAHEACKKLYPTSEHIAYPSFKEAYEAVEKGDADIAVLPLENSTAGEVGSVTDLLFFGSLYINSIFDLGVTHNLLACPGATLKDIKIVISHPQALMQCDEYIKKAGFATEERDNTALAAKEVAQNGDKTVAAVASEICAEQFGLEILEKKINTGNINTTRFALLGKNSDKECAKMHGAQFALMFTVKNEAGALARALNIIGSHGFNLRTLRSRPQKDLMWQYYFYAEAEGNINSYEGRSMLEEMTVCCDKIKNLGSFIKRVE